MFLYKTALLKKSGKNKAQYWRQISLFITQDTEEYVLVTFFGRSMQSLKEEKRYEYKEQMFGSRDFYGLKDQREREGYEVIELLSVKPEGLPFSDFEAPAFDLPCPEGQKSNIDKANSLICIPVYDGQRVYIKIGCESITSIQAMNTVNQPINLPEKTKQALLNKIKPGILESTVIEGYMNQEQLVITDVACINGIGMDKKYATRHKLLNEFFSQSETVRITNYTSARSIHLAEHSTNKDRNARYFLIKNGEIGFNNQDSTQTDFVVPNYYSMFVHVLGEVRNLPNKYKIGVFDNGKIVELGELYSEALLANMETIKVNFNSLEEGLPTNLWAAPENQHINYNKMCYIDQLSDVGELWSGIKSHEAVGETPQPLRRETITV